MTPEEYLRERLEYHLPDEQGKGEMVALLLPLLAMGARQSAAVWQGLREEVAQAVVLALKEDAERHLRIALDGSLERSHQILEVGEARKNLGIEALGMMAKAEAIKMDKARWQEAWILLDHATRLYEASTLSNSQKAIGWACTRVIRLFMSPEMEQTVVAFAEAEEAHQIFEQYGLKSRLITLHLYWARALDIQMEVQDSMPHYEYALTIAQALGDAGKEFLPRIYHNMAIALDGIGQTQQALAYLDKSLNLVIAERDAYTPSFRAIRETTIGSLHRYLGAYGRALRLGYRAEKILAETHPRQWLACIRLLMRCHLDLRRYHEAKHYGQILIERAGHLKRDLAFTHRFLAQAEIGLANYEQAKIHLATAKVLLIEAGFNQAVIPVEIEAAELALKQNQYHDALDICDEITLLRQGYPVGTYDIEVMIMRGEAYLGLEEISQAQNIARKAWYAARNLKRMPYQYRSHLLLGKIAEKRHNYTLAQRRYQAAMATTTRIQRQAGHTLHADISGSYQDAFHQLMRLALSNNQVEAAFTALEVQKSRLFLSYLQEKGRLQWNRTEETEEWLNELAHLRAEYNRLHRLLESEGELTVTERLGSLEQRIRRLTETLYLHAGDKQWNRATIPALSELQSTLLEETALLAYYDDGNKVWCFLVERENINVYPLQLDHYLLMEKITYLYENQQTTLQIGFPDDKWSTTQAKKARHGYSFLGKILLEPIASRLEQFRRLYIVPFGGLHRLPFNLLRIHGRYLIEWCEIVTLPSSALLSHKRCFKGVRERRWVGYSHKGKLPHAVQEVNYLQRQWGGKLYVEEEATATTLNGSHCQVVHLSTHGVHRVDHHFDLSYMALADADVYEDDLLQMELHHELVTLSACETGAVKVAPGEELIGLGRAFLYAGVGALVASLWQVREEMTVEMMDSFYGRLFGGASKAEALRHAQLTMLARNPQMHPVYWGAFQLVGSAQPLAIGE